jgi:hypothetical protein
MTDQLKEQRDKELAREVTNPLAHTKNFMAMTQDDIEKWMDVFEEIDEEKETRVSFSRSAFFCFLPRLSVSFCPLDTLFSKLNCTHRFFTSWYYSGHIGRYLFLFRGNKHSYCSIYF